MTWRRFGVLARGLSRDATWWAAIEADPIDDDDQLAAALADWNR